jgi:hypothetical protein
MRPPQYPILPQKCGLNLDVSCRSTMRRAIQVTAFTMACVVLAGCGEREQLGGATFSSHHPRLDQIIIRARHSAGKGRLFGTMFT